MLLGAVGLSPAQAQSWCRLGTVDVLVGGAQPACSQTAMAPGLLRSTEAVGPADPTTRVPAHLQAQRDADRRAILQDELHALQLRERTLLGDRGGQSGQATLRRTQDDMRAVRAELARLPGA